MIEKSIEADVKKSDALLAALLETLAAAAQLSRRLVAQNGRFPDLYNAFCQAKCGVQELTRLLQSEPPANAKQLIEMLRQLLLEAHGRVNPESYSHSLWGIDVLLACSMPGDSAVILLGSMTEANSSVAEAIVAFRGEKENYETALLLGSDPAVPKVPKHLGLHDPEAILRNKKRRFAMSVLGSLKVTLEQPPRVCEDKW